MIFLPEIEVFRKIALTNLNDLEEVPKNNLLSTSLVKMVDIEAQSEYDVKYDKRLCSRYRHVLTRWELLNQSRNKRYVNDEQYDVDDVMLSSMEHGMVGESNGKNTMDHSVSEPG